MAERVSSTTKRAPSLSTLSPGSDAGTTPAHASRKIIPSDGSRRYSKSRLAEFNNGISKFDTARPKRFIEKIYGELIVPRGFDSFLKVADISYSFHNREDSQFHNAYTRRNVEKFYTYDFDRSQE